MSGQTSSLSKASDLGKRSSSCGQVIVIYVRLFGSPCQLHHLRVSCMNIQSHLPILYRLIEDFIKHLHPWKLTWNPKVKVWKMVFLFKQVIFRFHVNFPGCTLSESHVFPPATGTHEARLRSCCCSMVRSRAISILCKYCRSWKDEILTKRLLVGLHPRNLTWNLKRSPQKRKFLLEPSFSGSMLNFGGVHTWTPWKVNNSETQY